MDGGRAGSGAGGAACPGCVAGDGWGSGAGCAVVDGWGPGRVGLPLSAGVRGGR
ncbi:hypothetical protein DUI70_5831 [Streptomyces albus]|nr:hypothetical protein DUI70_5831 [Streptomyces albus]